MMLSKEQAGALENYVSFCSRVYDAAFQSLRRKKYRAEECRHFASLMLIQTVDTQTEGSEKKESELKAYMATMTPGGSA